MATFSKGISEFLASLFASLVSISPKLGVMLWKFFYQLTATFYPNKDFKFMNFGYSPLDDRTETIDLDEVDADNRYYIQLYHHVVCSIDLTNLNVLEVGSGRGGGADWIGRYLKPKKVVGIDFSEKAVKFCNENYHVNGLSFKVGNAESLPLEDNSFDVAINVESSHCYGSMDAFLGEIERVLREGGYFLLADLRGKKYLNDFREAIYQSGLTVIKETDITLNVIKALELDDGRKSTFIKKSILKRSPQWLVNYSLDSFGVKGSKIYKRFKSGDCFYLSFILQKQTDRSFDKDESGVNLDRAL